MRRLGPALAIGGGLLLAASTSADWAVTRATREVGGVQLAEVSAAPGHAFTRVGVIEGLLAVGGGLLLLVLHRLGQRAMGIALVGVGVWAMWGLVEGWQRAAAAPGDLTAAPTVAGLGAIAVAIGGLAAAVKPAGPARPDPRYSVDEPDEDPEWRLAAGDDGES